MESRLKKKKTKTKFKKGERKVDALMVNVTLTVESVLGESDKRSKDSVAVPTDEM